MGCGMEERNVVSLDWSVLSFLGDICGHGPEEAMHESAALERSMGFVPSREESGLIQAQAMVEATGVVRSFRKSMQIEKMARDVTPGNTSVCRAGREREFWQKIHKGMIREIGERSGEWNVMECQGETESQGRGVQ